MTQSESATSPPASPAPQGQSRPAQATPIQRQFVNFAFFKLDPAFRRLDTGEKEAARAEFSQVMSQSRPGLMCLTYSTVGLRPDSDFLLWRIGMGVDEFQSQTQAINKTRLGGYLTTPHGRLWR